MKVKETNEKCLKLLTKKTLKQEKSLTHYFKTLGKKTNFVSQVCFIKHSKGDLIYFVPV